MAVSSASTRIFKQEDPVMTTDLELLAKVNTYQQGKFDAGEKALQDEVNNWSLLANVAKPQDKDYINAKLNKLVSGINNLGGINLADVNNVNQLKSLGYNMYGDDNVMNPVITTQKMNALAQDVSTKLNGKNAKDYDSVYGEYLQHQYGDWLNDGKQGTSFDGPATLPPGSFDQYNKKVQDALAKLQPDINETPQNNDDAALNYYQVGDKTIKKERVQAAIDAVTSASDKDVLGAHAWKSMRGLGDDAIVNLQRQNYTTKLRDLQDNYNYIQYQASLATDFKQKQLFNNQLAQTGDAIKNIQGQSAALPVLKPGQTLPRDPQKGIDVRKDISDNLFYDSFKEQYANSKSYDQKKVELKTNAANIFKSKQAQEDYWHAKDYDIKLADLKIKQRAEDIKEEGIFAKQYGAANGLAGYYGAGVGNGPGMTAPLGIRPVDGSDDTNAMSNDTLIQADANQKAAAKQFYEQGYDYLVAQDPVLYGQFLKQDTDGHWVPKDDKSANVVNKGLQAFTDMYSNISNMSIKERNGLGMSNEASALFSQSQALEEANLYKTQIATITSDVFRKAGLDDPNAKVVNIKMKNGTTVPLTYAELQERAAREEGGVKDPILEQYRQGAAPSNGTNNDMREKMNQELRDLSDKYSFGQRFGKEFNQKVEAIRKKYDYSTLGGIKEDFVNTFSKGNTVDAAIGEAKKYYNQGDVKKAWEDVSKVVNPYTQIVALPKDKKGNIPDIAAKTISDAIVDPKVKADININDIDISKVWTVHDSKTDQTKYLAEVRYRRAGGGADKKGEGGDKYTVADLTKQVEAQRPYPGAWLNKLYARDNTQITYSLALQNEGKTPFDPKNNFAGALQTHSEGLLSHKYQIIAVQDPKTKGTSGYRVSVAIPLGKDDQGKPKFQVMQVPNFSSDATGGTYTFPPIFEDVRQYMDRAFQNGNTAQDFYNRIGVPYNQ